MNLALSLLTGVLLLAAPGAPPLLFACEGLAKIVSYDADGRIAWEYPAEYSRDCWRLPNGNTLFCYNLKYGTPNNPSGVREVTPDKRLVFDFTTTGQVWSCQRLADGTTLVGAASQGKLLIVGADARVVRELKLKSPGGHSCLRNARGLADGGFLVAEEGQHAVREYAADGTLRHEWTVPFAPYSVVRLPNGHTLTCGQQTVLELDAAGQPVWRLDGREVPELGVRWFAGLQVLPDGHLLLCNAGGQVSFAEVDREKRIVWRSGKVPLGHGVQRLDVAGEALR